MLDEIVLAGACRTAIGSFGGSLAGMPATELGAETIKETLKRAGASPDNIGEVIMGCVLQSGLGQNPARQSGINAGIPESVPAVTINKVCGSGLEAVICAARSILCGDMDMAVAGGMENMSRAPYLLPDMRWGGRMGELKAVDSMLRDALSDAFGAYHMGITAENIAAKYGITRQEQDEYAVMSQNRAEAARKAGRFENEILPLEIKAGKGETKRFDTDEYPRHGASIDKISRLKPAFIQEGTVTAANSSGINDGAAAMLVMSAKKAKALGIKPMARLVSYASFGVDPKYMGLGPIGATRLALKKAGLDIGDIGLAEANEAFAAQAVAVIRELGLDPNKTNVNGGAIALGHPVGASGARILVTLLHELKKRGQKYGLATLCVGGGMGVSVIVENPEA